MSFQYRNGHEYKGYELPEDTLVYHWTPNSVDPEREGFIGKSYISFPVEKTFIVYFYYYVYESDGLWATPSMRTYWNRHPTVHPHSTLFSVLYHQLFK